jgi:PEP-CTERM motif-containing protein
MIMKRGKCPQFGLSLAAAICILCSPAVQADPLITVDELGHGTILSGGVPFAMPFALQSDPGPGGLASVLTYDLLNPPSLVAGDVLLQDGAGGPILDVIRFNPAGTSPLAAAIYPASLLFYSDNLEGFDSLGDTASPPGAFYTNTVTILEVGAEGDNGAFYTPTANQPGFVSGFAVQYHFISDGTAVPEPGSWTLMTAGLGALYWIRRKRCA